MKPADHPSVQTGGIGVLLVNLGTPDAPTPAALSDLAPLLYGSNGGNSLML